MAFQKCTKRGVKSICNNSLQNERRDKYGNESVCCTFDAAEPVRFYKLVERKNQLESGVSLSSPLLMFSSRCTSSIFPSSRAFFFSAWRLLYRLTLRMIPM